MTLASIIDDVTGNQRTLTVYDPADPAAVAALADHFEVQNVTVSEASVPEGPENFAVMQDDGEFLAAADVTALREAVTFESGLTDAEEFDSTHVPEILTHVSDTTFTAYGKQRMILASREVEERAWRDRGGELHAGFQRLSLMREQWDLYDRIASRGVSVHAYGEPDWDPPGADWLTVHSEDCAEISDSWFVAFDGPDGPDCALVSEERGPNEYEGFWTYDEALVADVLGHLREEYR